MLGESVGLLLSMDDPHKTIRGYYETQVMELSLEVLKVMTL